MFDKLILMSLNENNPNFLQVFMVSILSRFPNFVLKKLIQPIGYKMSWKNCAKVIIKAGYPKNKIFIDDMFQWLKDINWGGAEDILNYLPQLPKKVFIYHYEPTLKQAISVNDEDWIYSLYRLYKKAKFNNLVFRDKSAIAEMKNIARKY